jgi:tryptophan synthase alpha chain
MTYYNIAFNYGLKDFCRRSSELGVYGIILPDLPISAESTDHFVEYCRQFDLHPILLLTSTSSDARIQETVALASGIIYCVARKGVTGLRAGVADDLEEFLQRVRAHTQLPLAVGRGVSNKQQALQVAKFADLVIIGSAAMKTYIESEYNIQVLSDYFDNFL